MSFLACVLWFETQGLAESGPLVRIGEDWQYWKGTGEPTGGALEWAGLNFRKKDTWLRSPSGFGAATHETLSLGVVAELEPLADHIDGYVSAYFRKEFPVADRESIRWLTLRLDYQEGFVVYLNGHEVLRTNLPGTVGERVPVNTLAKARNDSGPQEFDLTSGIGWLRNGTNVLGIQVHSDRAPQAAAPAARSGELLCVPELCANWNRGPMVQWIQQQSAKVSVRTARVTQAAIDYGLNPLFGSSESSSTVGFDHEFKLEGLTPSTRYFYRVRALADGVEVVSETNSFRTFKAAGDIQFSVLGDTGTGGAAQLQVAQQLALAPSDLVLHCGNLQFPRFDPLRVEARCFSVYGRQMRSTPFFFSMGNTDIDEKLGLPNLSPLAVPNEGWGDGGRWSGDGLPRERYYSFDHGDVHFVCLFNPGYSLYRFGTNSLQYEWLERDLAATTKPWKVLFQHIPLRTSSVHRSDSMELEEPNIHDWERLQGTLMPLVSRYGVSVVFNGHDHCYERFSPSMGVHSVTTGGGGFPATGISELDSLSTLFLPVNHFLNVRVRGAVMTIRSIGATGSVLDEWQIRRALDSRTNYPASWSAPYLETAVADDGDGNLIGQTWDARWDLRDPEVYGIPSLTGLFSNLGRLRCSWDQTNLYFGMDRLMIPPGADVVVLVEVPNQHGVGSMEGLGNSRLDPGQEGVDGLDALWQLGFTNFAPSVAIVLGDEYGDGTDRGFVRAGALYGGGQGIFRLERGFPAVSGCRLQQFNRGAQVTPFPGEQNANYMEVSIPAVALGGLAIGDKVRVGVICTGPIQAGDRPVREIDLGFIGSSLRGGGFDPTVLEGIPVQLPLDEDPDRDGLSTFEELALGTDPELADMDGDGLMDGWEVVHRLRANSSSGASGAFGDPDGDLLVNLDEQKLGLNPRRKDAVPISAIQTADGLLSLRWPALAVSGSWLQFSSNPDGPFLDLYYYPPHPDLEFEEFEVSIGQGSRYFRLRLQPAKLAVGTSDRE